MRRRVPDATVVSAPFGIYVVDPVQSIQLVLVAQCRDETSTRLGVQGFFGKAIWIGCRLHHQWRHRADQYLTDFKRLFARALSMLRFGPRRRGRGAKTRLARSLMALRKFL
jgi:hypothetical protein